MSGDLSAAVITISDRASKGIYADETGQQLIRLLKENHWEVVQSTILPDDRILIENTLIEYCDALHIPLVLTAGGTGFSPRDVTPEATRAVLERETPGLVIAMVNGNLVKTPHAMLSRQVAGIRRNSLIVNLPGNPKGAVEDLLTILPALPHAISLIRSDPDAEKGHRSV